MKHSSTPRDVFAHLLAIGMLYVAVVSFLTIIFQYINILLPDDLSYSGFAQSSSLIRGGTAALIVVWPVYVCLMRLLKRDEAAEPDKHDLRIRKWLFNLTLFMSAITIIVALIWVIGSFLNGELTMRFLLKVSTVLAVAIMVFGYYRWELKREVVVKSKLFTIIGATVSSLILVTIIAGFFIAGTPQQQRQRRQDEQRVSDLSSLQYQIVDYWQRKGDLPPSLKDLNDNLSSVYVPLDPATKTDYRYEIIDPLRFKLCANFATKSVVEETRYSGSEQWAHDAGLVCFERNIDPDRQGLPKGAEALPVVID